MWAVQTVAGKNGGSDKDSSNNVWHIVLKGASPKKCMPSKEK